MRRAGPTLRGEYIAGKHIRACVCSLAYKQQKYTNTNRIYLQIDQSIYRSIDLCSYAYKHPIHAAKQKMCTHRYECSDSRRSKTYRSPQAPGKMLHTNTGIRCIHVPSIKRQLLRHVAPPIRLHRSAGTRETALEQLPPKRTD